MNAEEIEKQPVNNPLATIQGRLAGVEVVETSGVPGSGFDVRIRGQSSIAAGNEPLYIIDGVPYDARTLSNNSISIEVFPLGNISPLNAINPSNIESIEILKDADATAIYGSRGSNGVVLITTKKGKAGKTRFSINSSTGIAHTTRNLDLLNTEQYLAMRREAFANDGITEYPPTAYDLNGTWSADRYTDWQKELLGGTANTQELRATVSGGNAETQFLLSGDYRKENTVFPGNFKYNRLNLNSNINHHSLDGRFDLLFNVGYTLEDNKLPKRDPSYDALLLPPNAPALYDDNGELNWEGSTFTNPLAALKAIYKNNTKTLLSNATLSYRPLAQLEGKISLGYGSIDLNEQYTNPNTIYDPAYGLDSSASQLFKGATDTYHYIVEPQLKWEETFSDFELKLLVGATYQRNSNTRESFVGIGFPNNSFIENLQSATSLYLLEEQETEYSYQSFFARANIGWNQKLFLNLTGRRDGSSRFGPGNRYGNFGAVGAAYLFSEDLQFDWLNLGKVRASYGVTGNDQIGDYQYLNTYALGQSSYHGNIGINPARLYNPNFQWEVGKKAEVALELGILQNRLSMDLVYYSQRTSNQLINYTLPGTTGFTSILANLDAVVANKGLELAVEGILFSTKNFHWDLGLNLTLPKNELVKFPGLDNSTYANRFVIGQPLTIAKLYKLNGVNSESGIFEFEDYNGDGEISSPDDRQYIADLSPKYYGGVANSLKYNNWGLDFLFQFVKKDGYNQYYTSGVPGTMTNQPAGVLDRWQQPGDSAFMQQYTTGDNFDAYLAYTRFAQSSGTVSDASFVRLKTVDLSYSLPLQNIPNTSCTVSLRGQNLLTFTKFKGGDPEQSIGYIPSLRRIALNINLQF